MGSMPTSPSRDPLAATTRLLVDGTNLLHAMSKTPAAAPPAALIGRLRGIIPAATTIELVFDGPPERGLRNERIAAGVVVRYSGGRTADAVILTIIDDVRLLDGADGSAALLVVTDDRDLRHGSHCAAPGRRGRRGCSGGSNRAARSPSVGNPRPAPSRTGTPRQRASQRGWRPGRDGPAGWKPGARRDDEDGAIPATGAQGGRDW